MATRTISTRLAVVGESEYRTSMSRINSEIKTLQSSLKLTESEFQNNANSMEALTAKGIALEAVQKAQADKVKQLEKNLKGCQEAVVKYSAEYDELTDKFNANKKALEELDPKVSAAGKSWASQAKTVENCEKKLEELRKQSGDTSEAQAELEKKITAAKEKMTALEKETGGAAKAAGELLLENQKLDSELKLNAAYMEGAQKGVNNWERQLNTAKIGLNDVNAKIELSNQYMDEARNSADGCATSIDRFGNRVKESASNANDLRDALMAAGVVAALKATADALVACAESSIKFESAMAGVSKTTDMTGGELAAIGDKIQALATKIPATAVEIANVAEAAGQLGIAKEDLLSFTEVMINLGESTNLSSTEAASALAKFANVVKMSSDDYERLGSTIVALGNNFATTEADIVSMSTRLAATGELVGLTEPQIMAIATALSSVGIEAEAGGSAVSKLLKQFEVMISTGSPALEKFAAVAGMSAEEFATAWGNDAVGALSAFVDGLGAIDEAGGSSVAVLDELEITEVRLSNAVLALASSDGILTDALDEANAAWKENTALAKEASTRYETTESKLQMLANSAENVKIAVGDQLTPAIGNLADAGTDVLDWAADFIEQNDAIVPLVTASATAIGVLAAGITGYNVVAELATAVTSAFSFAMNANPIFLVATAVAALAAGLGILFVTMEDATNEYDELSAASKRQYDALQNLHAEYDRVCATYGETSAEAQLLKKQIDEETAAFERNKKTAEEVASAQNEVITAHNNLATSYRETISGIDIESQKTANLAKKLESLMAVEDKSAGTKQEILAVVDLLNEAMPELGLAYDSYADSLSTTTDSLEDLIEAETERERHQADYQQLKALTKEEAALADARAQAADEVTAAQQRLTDAQEALNQAQEEYKLISYVDWQSYASLMEPYQDAVSQAQEEVVALTEAESAAQTAYDENQASITSLTESLGAYAEETETAAASQESLIYAQQEVQTQIEDLAQKYKDAYDSARDSIDGQVGLFDAFAASVSKDTDTVEEMMSRWAEQTANLASYTENLRLAAQYGLDEGLVLSLSDGSAESAGYLATIIEEIERLGGTTEGMSAEAAEFVGNFNASFAETQTAKDEFAEVVATMETDFAGAVASIEQAAADADFSGVTEAMNEAFANVGHDFEQIGKDAAAGLSSGIDGNTGEVTGSAQTLAEDTLEATRAPLERDAESIGSEFAEEIQIGIESAQPALTGSVENLGEEITDIMTDSAKESVESYISAFSEISYRVESELTTLKDTVNSSVSSIPDSMYSIGQSTVDGMINGIYNRSGSLYGTIQNVVSNAIQTAKNAAAVNSPSKKTTEIFEFVGDGMVVGLENRRQKIKQTAQNVVDDALNLDVDGKIKSAIDNIDASIPLDLMATVMRPSAGALAASKTISVQLTIERFENYSNNNLDEIVEYVEDKLQSDFSKKEAGL